MKRPAAGPPALWSGAGGDEQKGANVEHNWEQLVTLLRGHTVRIQTHNFPDPDAIASAFGLQYLLRCFEIPAAICYDGKVDKLSVVKMVESFGIEMVPYTELPLSESDYVVLVDGQKRNTNITDIPGDEVACIDHHPTLRDCTYRYQDIRVTGACASIIAEYLQESGVPLTETVASALFYGLKMDTDSFNRGITKTDIAMFDFLYEYTDMELVNRMYYNNMELLDLRAYGAAIENIQIFSRVGIAHIPFACEDALAAMVADFILKLDVVTFAVIYVEKDGGLKFSVRSEEEGLHAGNITAAALQGLGSGGGHAEMAGGYIPPASRAGAAEEDYILKDRFLDAIAAAKAG